MKSDRSSALCRTSVREAAKREIEDALTDLKR
jgi:hypothetical protein